MEEVSPENVLFNFLSRLQAKAITRFKRWYGYFVHILSCIVPESCKHLFQTLPSMVDTLPENLILDVLSRLHVKTIIRCKCVCKKWRGLVSDPLFVHLHLSRSREALMVDKFWPVSFLWVEIEHKAADADYYIVPVKTLNLNLCVPECPYGILQVGPVNGLICCCQGDDVVYVFNPVLHEYLVFPKPCLKKSLELINYGFGISMAGEYKVIRICGRRVLKNRSEVYAVEVEVYTLGTDQWRSLRKTPYHDKKTKDLDAGVFVNGHVYWLEDGRIYVFDLNTETFELFPSPPGDNRKSKQLLGVLKGRLSHISWWWLGFEVWVMKKESWCKDITVRENLSPILIRSHPLCLIDGLNGTSTLMVYDQATEALVAYCLNRNTFLHMNRRRHVYRIMTFRPSFVKLQDFRSERLHAKYNRARRIPI